MRDQETNMKAVCLTSIDQQATRDERWAIVFWDICIYVGIVSSIESSQIAASHVWAEAEESWVGGESEARRR